MRVRNGCRVALETALFVALACPLIASSSISSDHGRWADQVSSDGRSYFTGEPNCHPSDYFEHDAQHLLYQQSVDLTKQSFFEDTFVARPIGELSGHKIAQYDHLINQSSQRAITVKMLLVERKPKELCEIYHQEWGSGEVQAQPAYLVNIGDEVILASTDPFRSGGGWLLEFYWTFDTDGPINLGVDDKIEEIKKRLLRKGSVIKKGGGFDVHRLSYSMDVWRAEDPY